jgi:pimeloyl-ACP methyl ester carboxylesterase
MRNIYYLISFLILFSGCKATKGNKFDDYVFKTRKEKSEYVKSYNRSLSLWKVPFSEEDVKTSFGTAHVTISGPKDAKPLVLLHGMDASSTMWFPNIDALSKNRRVYAIDFLMEPGKSVSLGKTLSKEEVVIWYAEIFQHYGLKKIEIVGASRGGWIGTLLAIQKGSMVTKLVLLSPAQTFKSVDEKRKASSALLMKLFPNKKKMKKALNNFSYYPEKINPVFKSQFYLAHKFSKTNRSFLQMQPFSDDELKKISIPVLVLIGDHDVINSEESLEKAKKLLGNYKGSVLINAGHFLTIDQAEVVNKTVVEFLEK